MEISRQNAYPSVQKALCSIPNTIGLIIAAHICNPSTWVFEAEGFKLRVIFSYMVSLRVVWTT